MPEAERSRRSRGARRALTLAAFLFLLLSAAAGRAVRDAADPATLFARGDLEGARRAAGEAVGDPQMALLRGRLALYGNDLSEAERWLAAARAADPASRETAAGLAELRYRQLRFDDAATLLREIGETARADQLAGLSGRAPYTLDTAGESVLELPFLQTDPLPLVEARINGSPPVVLLIDTGASELILDPEFAAQVGAATFGRATGTFGGGAQADYELGTIGQLALGSWTVSDVPVRLLPTRRFAAVAGGRQVEGILGTNLFYRLRATLDYPAGRLRLEAGPTASRPPHPGAVEIPFWLAGDHFLLARGRAGHLPDALFLIDTGLAGPAFAAPRSTLQALGVEVQEDQAQEGIGGGGKIRVAPFQLSRLSLGPITREGLVGIAGAFPEKLEHAFGFPIAGLVSHAFFRDYALTFDFQAMRLVLTPGPAPPGPD